MDNLDTISTETEDFNTIARMLNHIRDSARQLDASALEYCIEMAMKAVSNELKSREEIGVSIPDFETAIRFN
ncbi:MAG TPA: hypothetical protein VL202_24895 [Pararhizobium sp.]|uniref:hypothetical protein n=1 Tax=Pararhizobium sp. TaxID=1977563 RepID=UPI002B6AD6A8|nr:hypothetical protein [Pararhizobium sp.]HTO34380.1 hypothetical protein [Pararhizobium sp.]